MNKIRQKITSQSGASITYALLLFLVCAVVSSVVLAAGTAASGRMSGSVEADQRYYNVSSAVELLKDLYDDVKVEIVTITQDGATTIDDENSGVYTRDPDSSDWTKVSSTSEGNYKLLIDAAKKIVGQGELPADAMGIFVDNEKNATITVKEDSSGERLVFKVSSYEEDKSHKEKDEKYTLYALFDADTDIVKDSRTKNVWNGSEYVPETVVTITNTMIWKYSDAVKYYSFEE